MATASGKDLRTLQRGHTLYVSHCGRCHEPQLPATVNAADWHIVVPGMAWNAGLRKHQEQDVLHYILAAKTATP